jgi:putative aminopeptidase FrvX
VNETSATGIRQPAADPVALLAALEACPTTSFHEAYVAARIWQFCRELGLHVRQDVYGNLVATPDHLPQLRDEADGRPTVALVAHMDHPGLEVTGDAPLVGVGLGGISGISLQRPEPVRFFTPDGMVPGRVLRREEGDGTTVLRLEADGPVPAGAFGMWDVGPFREEGELLYGPAADDLGGCAAILAALAECRRRELPVRAAGLFTRAEEVGLVGATLAARQELVPRSATIISLETSRALPGAEMGGGPVIRVGDASTAFHHEGEALLRRAAARLREADPNARIQRQLMYGGTCEATAFVQAGYVATGVAFPLGNYHNAGPDGRAAPEFIHRQDLITGTALLVAAIEEAARAAALDPVATRLIQRADELGERLRLTAAGWTVGHGV